MNRIALSASLVLCTLSATPAPPAFTPSIELNGTWLPGNPDDDAFGLKLTIGGGVLDGTVGQVGIWLFDDPEWDLWDKRPESAPLLEAQVRFPCKLDSKGLPFRESGEAKTLFVFIDRGGDLFQAVMTVPVLQRAELVEYVAAVEKSAAMQPRIEAKTGFEVDGAGDLLFDLGLGDDDELFSMNVPTGETVEEIWIWAYTPEMPVGWPVPAATPNLHHATSPSIVDGRYVLNVNADVSGLDTTVLWPNRNVYLFAMVAVDDGTGATKYYQHKTTSDIKAVSGGTGEFNAFRMKPNPIGVGPVE